MINKDFNEIILHCSATKEGQNFDVENIRKWHTSSPNNWKDIGYHFVIKLDGTIQKGRDITEIGSHCKDAGKNHTSIGICYVGGIDSFFKAKDTRTEAQKKSIDKLIKELVASYPQLKKLSGHNDYANKACPSFKVSEQYQHLKDIIEV